MRYSHAGAGLDLAETNAFSLENTNLGYPVKYPRNWLKLASPEEIAALGFVAYEPDPVDPPEPSTDPNDYVLTRRQLRLGLLGLGITDSDVMAAIDAMPDAGERAIALIEWEDAQFYHFDHPLVATLMTAVGLTSEAASTAWMGAAAL